ncbi:permease (plasmid) [Gemmatirosa kalamazoonensis]|uniref:Permease n=1 Tax=Gemmatirosa kalamazoonensis TaxID=861299 RepID=W0RS64_9BACT|nr:ABC transporter permease [Gemmatirosa kalamazoonensis]AHG92433.1 permease [Gemmatirosa kalamazoonensis]
MAWYRRLFTVARAGRRAREFERERAFHLAERADELRAAGLAPHAAAAEARRRFGNPAVPRGPSVATWLESAAGDARRAARSLRRSPLFALVAVGSIALGMGATTAIYSLLDAVSLRALPVPHPDELLQVGTADRSRGGVREVPFGNQFFTNPLWEALRDRPNGFASVAAYGTGRVNLAPAGEARWATLAFVSGDYFRLFGVAPEVGRLFSKRDDVRGCPAVAVLGHAFWQRTYAGDRHVVGRTISLDGTPFEIVGVTRAGFTGPEVGRVPQVLVPLCAEAAMRRDQSWLDARSTWWLAIIGRRASDVSPTTVAARLQAIAADVYGTTVPSQWGVSQQREYASRTFAVAPVPRGLSELRSRFGRALAALMAFVALVMVIACVNVANLLLARTAARRHELAVRLAIGAERARLVRQLLAESVLLAVSGAATGLLVARWGAAALVAMISTPRDTVELDLALNGRLLAFAALAATATLVIFGVLPAWRGSRVAPQSAMRGAGRGVAEGHSRFTTAKMLVAAQVALSLVLLVAAGLLVGSLRKLATEDPGFRPDGVLIVRSDLRQTGLPEERLGALREALLAALRAVPGAADASASEMTPIGDSAWNEDLVIDGYTPKSPEDALVWFNSVTPHYFATMRTRLLLGRDFDATDRQGAPRVVIVNEAFVRKFFGAASPLGRHLGRRMGDTMSAPFTIVGVVENAKYRTLREDPSPTVYVAMTQEHLSSAVLTAELRAAGDGADAAALAPAARAAVARVDPRVVVEFRTLSGQVASSISRERLLAVLSAVFGAVALALATLGLYGVMAYSVTRRTTEIGVRQALGADRARVVRMVLADVGRVVVVGAIVGAAAAAPVGRFMESLLFRTRPVEPLVIAGAAALLALVALVAGLVPARRASRVAPMTALREE